VCRFCFAGEVYDRSTTADFPCIIISPDSQQQHFSDVEATMKKIMTITSKTIHYLDDEGNSQFIEFETCHQNNIRDVEQRMGDVFNKEFWQKAKYVGRRFAHKDPPSLVFYTIPPIEFEFPTREHFSMVLSGIKKAGWRTNNGE
jgi:hypothetical protein